MKSKSLESEGGVTGAAAFGTKRGRMPSAKIAIAQLYGWSSSGGFAEATCLEAEPGCGQMKITEDLAVGNGQARALTLVKSAGVATAGHRAQDRRRGNRRTGSERRM